MNTFVLSLIAVAMNADYLVRIGWLPRLAKFLPEIFSGLVLLYVVVAGVRTRFAYVRPGYWFAFGAMLLVMLCGVVANGVDTGPVFAGIRAYLRAAPLFFLAAVYAFNGRQIRSQLLTVLVLCVPQLPISIYQRMTSLWWGDPTGDTVSGTLLSSAILSIFLICAVCVLTAAFLRKRISLARFLPIFLLLLVPTAINETKATAVLLPIGLLFTFIAASAPGNRAKHAVVGASLLMLCAAVFIPTYDYFIGKKNGTAIMDFFTESEHLDRYMSKDAGVGVKNIDEVGRFDAIRTPFKEMLREPTHTAFGLGIGNASSSSLGRQFNGAFFDQYGPFLKSSASAFILEIGLLGLAIVLMVFFLVYRDSRAVADADEGVVGILAAGWAGAAVVMAISIFYTSVDANTALSYLFWYFSGVVAAQRLRMARHVA